MKHILFTLFIYLIFIYNLFSQNENKNWFFGEEIGLSFNQGAPQVVNGKVFAREGCSVMSDPTTGKLLFYTDGVTVWNKNHDIMINGNGLLSGSSSTQGSVIVPSPFNKNRYYIFTVPNLTSFDMTEDFMYSIVDMSNGLGSIVQKNVFIAKNMSEKITATKTCSGNGYWILTHNATIGEIYAYLLNENGFNTEPVVFTYDNTKKLHDTGYMRFSPDGEMLCVASTMDLSDESHLVLFDFDNVTGKISNQRDLHTGVKAKDFYGVCFSPDSKMLYVSGTLLKGTDQTGKGIIQFDLSVGKNYSATIFISTDSVYAMQLSPEGKVYVAVNNRRYLNVINNPNRSGTACDYKTQDVRFARRSFYGLPNFVNYKVDIRAVDTIETCANEDVRIGVERRTGYSYQWIPQTGLSDAFSPNPIFHHNESVSYRLQIIKNNICTTYHDYYVKIEQTTAIEAKPSFALLCSGSSIRLNATGGTSYKWTPVTGLSNPFSDTPICNTSKDIVYTVTITNGTCVYTKNVEIKIAPPPKADAGNPKYICSADSVLIGTAEIEGETYMWTPAEGLSNTTVAQPKTFPLKSTMYYLQVNRGDRCVSYDSVLVTIGKIEATIIKDTSMCSGNTIQLFASGGDSYKWFPVEGLNNPNIPNPTASPLTSTRYSVIVTSGNCFDTLSVNVQVIDPPIANAGIDRELCKHEFVKIGSEGNAQFTYSWQPTDYLDDPKSAMPICYADKDITYILTVINSNNCVAYDTVHITAVPAIQLRVSNETTVCPGEEVQLYAEGAEQYEWFPIEGLNNPTIPNPIAKPLKSTTYYVIGKSGKCSEQDSVTINVRALQFVSVSGDKVVCAGNTVPLFAYGAESYIWSPVEGLDNPNISNPIFSGDKTTLYTVTGKKGNCFDTKTVEVMVNKKPEVNISENRIICLGDTVHLYANGAESYMWTPSTYLNNPSIQNPISQPTENIVYTVRGMNKVGCYEEKEVRVTVRNEQEKFVQIIFSDTIKYTPGTQFPVTIQIPSGIENITMSLLYDPCCVRCDSVFSPDNGIKTLLLTNEKLRFSVYNETTSARMVRLPCTVYLPFDGRKNEQFTISDIIHDAQCLTINRSTNSFVYDQSCAWNIRGVHGSEKFDITISGEKAILNTGLGGKTILSIYDMTGQEVWKAENTYLSSSEIEISLPELSGGVYILRAANYVWKKDVIMVKE